MDWDEYIYKWYMKCAWFWNDKVMWINKKLSQVYEQTGGVLNFSICMSPESTWDDSHNGTLRARILYTYYILRE